MRWLTNIKTSQHRDTGNSQEENKKKSSPQGRRGGRDFFLFVDLSIRESRKDMVDITSMTSRQGADPFASVGTESVNQVSRVKWCPRVRGDDRLEGAKFSKEMRAAKVSIKKNFASSASQQ